MINLFANVLNEDVIENLTDEQVETINEILDRAEENLR